MKRTAQIYKFIEANRSLDKLNEQNLEYPIKVAYNLIKARNELNNAIDYVMERFGIVCGNNVDFDNISDEHNKILNSILSQEIEIDLPDIDIEDIISTDNVSVLTSDVENLIFLFGKNTH